MTWLALDAPPTNKAAFFSELTRQFQIEPRVPPAATPPPPQFRKPVSESYLALSGNRQLSKYLASGKEFECALHDAQGSQPPAPVTLRDTVTWGGLLAFALRSAVAAASHVGSHAVITHPLDDAVRAFYARFHFEDLPGDPKRAMFVRISELAGTGFAP